MILKTQNEVRCWHVLEMDFARGLYCGIIGLLCFLVNPYMEARTADSSQPSYLKEH